MAGSSPAACRAWRTPTQHAEHRLYHRGTRDPALALAVPIGICWYGAAQFLAAGSALGEATAGNSAKEIDGERQHWGQLGIAVSVGAIGIAIDCR